MSDPPLGNSSSACNTGYMQSHGNLLHVFGSFPILGPVEDVCKSVVCENGKVTLSRPSQCPRIWLMCVDPKLDEDCCPYCPRGNIVILNVKSNIYCVIEIIF